MQKTAAKAAAEIEAEMEEENLETSSLLECFSRCMGNEDKAEALGNLKKELDIDWHTKPIEQLQAEYGTKFKVVRDRSICEELEIRVTFFPSHIYLIVLYSLKSPYKCT